MAKYLIPDQKDPAYQLIIGNPSEIISATKSPRILVIGLHGTEHLAARVAHHLQTQRPDLLQYVDYICGNPKAAAAIPQERYIDADLNRSFTPKGTPKTYEEKRAAELIPQLKKYNYVLDLHTTTTSAGSTHRFAITTQPDDPEIQTAIAASSIERVVIMPPGDGYMVDVIRPTIAFEYNQEFARTPVSVDEIVQILDVLTEKKKAVAKPREFFYVTRPIPRAEDPGIDTPNFEVCKDGYYPVLLGDNSYRKDPTKPYVGFAATKKAIITL